MAQQKRTPDEQEAYIALRKILKRGDTVYTILRHVSASGMQRVISVVVVKRGQPLCLDWEVARLCGYKRSERHDGALVVGGGGMDMGFAVVYRLSSALFRRARKPRHAHHLELDDSGYALEHCWL